MERADKIFTILAGVGLVAVLVCQRTMAGPITNRSATPALVADTGPAYLLSALPSFRPLDDYAAPVSYSEKVAF